MSYFPSIRQNVLVDAANSLAAGGAINAAATWNSAGVGTSTLGVNAIQIVVKSDQNLTIYVDQGSANNSFQVTDSFKYYSAIGNFGITIQAVGAFVRVRATNTTVVNATAVQINTVLCPIVEAVPRSLDAEGNLKVAIKAVEDIYGFESENTPIGETRVVEPVRIAGTSFSGPVIETSYWNVTATGSGGVAAAQANAQLLLTSGIVNANAAVAYTMQRARYIGGSSMRVRGTLQLDAGTANNTRRWGIGYGATLPTMTDGAWFQMSGTTFSVVTMKGTTPTAVDSGSFNGLHGGTYSPDTNIHTYEIYYTSSYVYFIIDGLVLHTVHATAATWTSTMGFHGFFDNRNSGIAVSVTLAARVFTIYRLGKPETEALHYHIAGANAGLTLRNGPGRLHTVIINAAAEGSSISLYDATSAANPIAIIVAGLWGIATLDYHLNYYTGLYVVTTNAATDVTIVYE
jgi:hypothetical protein